MLRSRAQALLEFDVIRERVADRTTYFPARRLAESMQPSYDEYEVSLLQQETAEGGRSWTRQGKWICSALTTWGSPS